MIDGGSFIFVLFRWINFAIVLGLFFYLFKKFLFKNIQQKIIDKKEFFQSLQATVHQVQEQKSAVEQSIVRQQKEAESLLAKVQQWSQAQEQKTALASQELQETIDRYNEQRQEQLSNFALQEMRNAVLPKAIEKAAQQLQTDFQQRSVRDNYMQNIISFMRKST